MRIYGRKKITLENFKDHVTPFELRKGQDYFDRGKVSELQRSATGRWTAIVKGREPYKVRFDVAYDGTISEIFCDCIAQAENEYCKHVLAMLLAIEKSGFRDAPPPVDYEYATKTLELKVRTAISSKDYPTAANTILAMIKSMPSIVEQQRDDVEDMVDDRVSLGFKLMLELARLPIPEELKERMYRRSADTAMDIRWKVNTFDPHWIDVMVLLSKGKEAEALKIIDNLLALNTSDPFFDHQLMRLVSHKIDLMRAMGKGAEVPLLLNDYPQSKLLWDRLLQDAANAGDYAQAKWLAESGIKALFRDRLRDYLEDTLFRLAQQFKDVETTRQYALVLYKRSKDLTYYRLLKETYEPAAWSAVVEKEIIRPLGKADDYPYQLAAIYAEEQDWPRLIKLLQKKPVFVVVQKFTDVLLPHYPAELLALYRLGLIDYASNDRKKGADAIAEIAGILKEMKTWPGGRKAVAGLVDEFNTLFPTRKKLLEVVNGLK